MFEKACRSIMMAALVMGAAACAEKAETDNMSDVDQEKHLPGTTIVFTAAGEDLPQTKTALFGGTGDDRNKVKFCEGDALSVWYDIVTGDSEESYSAESYSTKFEMQGSVKSDGSADFSGEVESAADRYFVIYPYVEGMFCETTSRGGMVINHRFSEISIPTQQKAVAGSFDPLASFSAGVSVKQDDGHHTIVLKNLCSLIKFSVPEGTTYKKAVLRSSGNEIAGAISLKLASDNTWSIMSTPESKTVTLKGNITSGNDYYFVVAPFEIKGFSIELYHNEDDTTPFFTKTTSKNLSTVPGRIYNVGNISDSRYSGWKGDGSAQNPFLIESVDDLKHLQTCFSTKSEADKYAGKYFLQTSDIDCNGEVLGIGSSDGTVKFTGNYDGGKYVISNFVLQDFIKNTEYGTYVGLFRTAYDASFTGMRISPKIIDITDKGDNGNISMDKNIGSLVGRTESSYYGYCSITDCIVLEGQPLNLVKPALVTYGGLVGTNNGNMKITGCENRSTIIFNSSSTNVLGNPQLRIGGLVGEFVAKGDDRWCEIDRCRNTAEISITDSFQASGYMAVAAVGGIIGKCVDPTDYDSTLRITNCVNTGDIKVDLYTGASAGYAGGIVGNLNSDGDSSVGDPYVFNCLNKGYIYCKAESIDRYDSPSAGGIIGYGYNPYISTGLQVALCVNTGYVYTNSSNNRASISCGGYICVGCYWLKYDDELPGYTGFDLSDKNYSFDSGNFSATLNSARETLFNSASSSSIEVVDLLKDKAWWTSGKWVSWKGDDAYSLDLDF